ncbi:hypothetical protein [Streptomyces lydicus]|uniref:Uncharacterized protein n=1 Tax=Streptomyces lydicus TaxID=47763 RepID=A0A1D7VRD6_9ACTN|nr:hypothetical protein [Streptomyces lydicus]AOP49291.1 hypothetical protein SL103_26310 [Streptomyces lydicus]
MKIRHVRAVTVCALVVVALTGARHSHGGGCGSSHSSSSSSSGGYSGSSGGYGSSGTTTSSGSTVGSPTAGSTTSPEADIRITDCQVDNAAGTLSARLSVTNGNTRGMATYNGTVQFTDGSGGYVGTAEISSVQVAAGQTRPAMVSGTFIKNPNGGPTSGRCKLGQVWKVNS